MIRAYLKKDVKAEDLGGFEVREEDRVPYVNLPQEYEDCHLLPSVLEGKIEFFSIADSFLGGRRENGVYKLKTASGTVEMKSVCGKYICIHARAKTLEDLRDFITEVRVGSLRPVTSFQGPQLGDPAYRLAEKIQQLLDHGGEEAARKLESMLAIVSPVLPPAKDPNFLRPVTVF